MRARIHRGATEVGGNLVELESQGQRIVLDAGLPLENTAQRDLLPDVPGLWARGDGSLLGLLISHGHPDHYGLAEFVTPEVPIYVGEHAGAILREAAFFVPSMEVPHIAGYLRHREPIELGSFAITPWLVDHSAFDAYALLVEAEGRRLLYTGDIRAHGRKQNTLDMLACQAAPVDVLLMEGTRIGASTIANSSEADVEEACRRVCRETPGMVLAFYSPQNVDRLVTLFRAAKRSGRLFVMDLYAAAVATATGRDTIPQAEWEGVRVYVPRSQRRRVIESREFERVDAVRPHRVYPEELARSPERFVMTCRGSMLAELERVGCFREAEAIWSMWPGYLQGPAGQRLCSDLDRLGIGVHLTHASGHASREQLVELVGELAPACVVPIHTRNPTAFARLFSQARVEEDGSWWEV